MIPSGQEFDDYWHDVLKGVALVLCVLAGVVLGWVAFSQ